MNNTPLILPLFACVLLTADGQEEWRKEGSVAALPHPDPTQPSGIPKGNSEYMDHKREKRTPDAKKLDDGSFGYAWNVGNGMSYMKMHVGKSSNLVGTDNFAAAQHQVMNSLRPGEDSYQQKQNDKTDYERLHKDFLKTSQQIATQKNNNRSVKPGVGNPKTHGVAKQEFNFEDKNIGSFAFDKEQKKANEKLQDFNTKLKHEYDKFNSDIQFSRLPLHQAHSLRELNVAQDLKQNGKGDYESGDAQVTLENKPINGFVYNNGFLKNQHHFALLGNLDNVFKTIEVPWQESSNNHFAKSKEADTMDSDQNTFKEVDEQKVQNVFSKTPGEALTTQNVVSDHQRNVEDSERQPDHEETTKTAEGHVQKTLSEISYTPQIEMGSQGNNGYGNRFINEMHPEMNQKLISEQVEKIKQIQQKVIETHFPGPGIYSVLDGNAQHGFTTQEHPMHSQGNIEFLKQQEESRGIEQSNTRLAYGLQDNREVINTNFHKESTEPNVGTESFSSPGHGHSIVSSKRHRPFIINNAQGPQFMQNQFFSGHEFNNGSGSESNVGINDETHWRPLHYIIKPKNEHQTHLQNGTYESEKLKNEDSLNWNDGRKGREIKSSFEHEDSIQTHEIYDHPKEHFYGSEEHEEAKIIHPGYPQFHKYPHQEPHVRVVTKAVPVHKELKIPVPQMVRHPILIPVPYKVLEPYPIKIPVPVTVEKTVEVPVEKVIHYPVEKPVPVKVIKKIKVPVPKPYPVKVPVYKIKYVHHNKKKHEGV